MCTHLRNQFLRAFKKKLKYGKIEKVTSEISKEIMSNFFELINYPIRDYIGLIKIKLKYPINIIISYT